MSGVSSRDLVVRLMAQSNGFENGMKSAAASADTFARELDKLEKKQAADAEHAARLRAQAYDRVGKAALVAGGTIVTGFGLAARASMAFEKQMSEVGAVSSANSQQLKALSDAALQAGKATVFSAKQAAQGEAELAKAGVSVTDILNGGLIGALNLASAGSIDVSEAASIAATSMVQFGLSGKDVSHIADLLAAGANQALGSVSDLGQALKYVGPVASQMGVSIEETVGTLAEFAQNGLLADQAGTGFRGVLMSLTSASPAAAATMKQLGINLFDNQGKFIGMAGTAGELQRALGGLTEKQRDQALGQMFGNQQITAARVLYKGGAADVEAWTKSINKDGYATDLAAKKMDNLSGDLENLKGSLETALIKTGSKSNTVLRDMAQAANAVVGAYIDLPGPVQGAVTATAGISGAVSLATGAFMLGVPKIAAFKTALEDMGPKSQRFGKAVLGAGSLLTGPWGLALAGGVIALGAYGHAHAETVAKVEAFSQAILADSGALGENTRQLVVNNLEKQGVLKTAEHLGLSLSQVTDAAMGNADAMHEVTMAAGGITDVFARGQFLAGLIGTNQAMNDGADAAHRQADALKDAGGASGAAGTSQAALAGAVGGATGQVQAQVKTLSDLLTALQKSSDFVLGLRDANRGYEGAIDAASKALHDNGRTLDVHTEKGRANSAALDEVAKSAGKVLQGLADNGATLPRVTKEFHAQHTELVALGIRFGMTKTEAENYATSVLKIPKTVQTKASVDTATADQHVVTLLRKLEELDGTSVTATVQVPIAVTGLDTFYSTLAGLHGTAPPDKTLGGILPPAKHADGGLIVGPGTGTSDSVPALLSNGEFVMNAAATRQNLPTLRAMNTGYAGSVRMAGGGRIRWTPGART